MLENTDESWHKCRLDHSLCNSMLNLKFPVTMAIGGRFKFARNQYFALCFSFKNDFKVLQLLNGLRLSKRLFSVGYTLPCNQPEIIFSLSHVQNVLDDDGNCRPLQTSK
jgi:hypothetical protein